jgi:hypothetical protein
MVSASTACATVWHGVRQDIYVTSEPRGAMVVVGSKIVGPTPTVVTVYRRSSPTLRFELNGYEPLTVPLKRSISGLVAADAIALNPLSCQGLSSAKSCPGFLLANLATFFGIDFLAGGAFKFPRSVNGVLTKR